MKKIKLEVGEIWQKPNTLDVRTINNMNVIGGGYLWYRDIGGTNKVILKSSFRRWIRRNEFHHRLHGVQRIGHYDFEKKKAKVVK